MKQVFIFLLAGAAFGLVLWLWTAYRRFAERSRGAEERFATAMTEAALTKTVTPPATDLAGMAQQKLLYDAASKAGEAGEAVLSIQLYARLLARYPDSSFGVQARAAVEAQKKKLVVKS